MELSIDTASEMASLALSLDGTLQAEVTWRCRRNHTVELLPTIDRLLAQAGVTKGEITAVFACTGPGMYTGLRVGVSTAQGLAYALKLPVLGVGRLELDAYQHAAFPGRIVAVHRAGRGELAWAAYRSRPWREVTAPRLDWPADVVRKARGAALFCGEVDDELAAMVAEASGGRGVVASPSASVRRAGVLAELGWRRLAAGEGRGPEALRVVYLRPPAIAPQTRP
ncbi:MAG: tRNA (adenosine(37)-N6)-threonylcarbamoyltransferase complex dimerization subunit type 1 TsaB, partial [Dehalococcoidia bacterium]|nr:tRNA (adenosine(37)-N6)-threonylcarbamoyltransferase complex dimerization subunit type 1 TsaB [Dehalococcoidia bacterium]